MDLSPYEGSENRRLFGREEKQRLSFTMVDDGSVDNHNLIIKITVYSNNFDFILNKLKFK